MARRLEARDADELALDDKLDVARTMLALGKRIELRHQKELVLSAIKQSHREEVNRGEVSAATVPTANEIIGLLAKRAPALGEGADKDHAGNGDHSS